MPLPQDGRWGWAPLHDDDDDDDPQQPPRQPEWSHAPPTDEIIDLTNDGNPQTPERSISVDDSDCEIPSIFSQKRAHARAKRRMQRARRAALCPGGVFAHDGRPPTFGVVHGRRPDPYGADRRDHSPPDEGIRRRVPNTCPDIRSTVTAPLYDPFAPRPARRTTTNFSVDEVSDDADTRLFLIHSAPEIEEPDDHPHDDSARPRSPRCILYPAIPSSGSTLRRRSRITTRSQSPRTPPPSHRRLRPTDTDADAASRSRSHRSGTQRDLRRVRELVAALQTQISSLDMEIQLMRQDVRDMGKK